MASMLCLANIGYTPPKPVCDLSTSINNSKGNDKLHFRLNHTSPSLHSTSKYMHRNQPGQHFHPVICALDERPSPPSRKDENENKIKRSVARASLVLAGALGVISAAGFGMNSRALADPGKLPTKAPQSQEVSKAGICALLHLKSPEPQQDRGPSLEEVQKKVIKEADHLMAEEKFKKAENFLKKTYKDYEHKNYSQVLNDVDLALVKVLIKLEKYEEASSRKCLEDQTFTKSHPVALLYKAYIFAMLRRLEEAMKSWDEYVEAAEGAIPNPQKQ